MATGRRTAHSREKKFSTQTCHSSRIRWPVDDMVEMRPYIRFNKDYHYILTIIDMLSKYAWYCTAQNKKWNWDGYDYKNNSRRWKMFEKFANRYRKRILQCKCTNTLEETRHQPLFYVFHNGKRQSSNDSIVKYDEKRRCRNNLLIMEIINGSICISYLTTCESIKLSVCDLSM